MPFGKRHVMALRSALAIAAMYGCLACAGAAVTASSSLRSCVNNGAVRIEPSPISLSPLQLGRAPNRLPWLAVGGWRRRDLRQSAGGLGHPGE